MGEIWGICRLRKFCDARNQYCPLVWGDFNGDRNATEGGALRLRVHAWRFLEREAPSKPGGYAWEGKGQAWAWD